MLHIARAVGEKQFITAFTRRTVQLSQNRLVRKPRILQRTLLRLQYSASLGPCMGAYRTLAAIPLNGLRCNTQLGWPRQLTIQYVNVDERFRPHRLKNWNEQVL